VFKRRKKNVAPRRGAWIETVIWLEWRKNKKQSHPAGVRGLKRSLAEKATATLDVAPRRGAWIETDFSGYEKVIRAMNSQ